MLQNFRFARYRFTYTVQEPLKMPQDKGTLFYNRFGYTLRHVSCIGDTHQCDTQCQFPDRCVYAQCFETPVPDDSRLLRDQSFAPSPFVLEPPRTRQQAYVPGETLSCHLVLIGDAINLLPWIVFTFNEIGTRRIGLQGERGRCLLRTVESLPARESDVPQTIYTAETQMLTDEGRVLRLDDVGQTAPSVADRIALEFLTPTSIKIAGRSTSDLRFGQFFRSLVRRIRLLSYFHCGEDLDVDVSGLLEAANFITHESHFRWLRTGRGSHRATSALPMSGFIGTIRFSGNLTPFLPFIYLGAYLHIGHHTAFGGGQYRITEPTG